MSKHNKQGKGQVFRPCYICGEIVNYIYWQQQSIIKKKKIYHWANEDGSHHTHAIKELSSEQKHLNEISLAMS
jgi:hypothetical protein